MSDNESAAAIEDNESAAAIEANEPAASAQAIEPAAIEDNEPAAIEANEPAASTPAIEHVAPPSVGGVVRAVFNEDNEQQASDPLPIAQHPGRGPGSDATEEARIDDSASAAAASSSSSSTSSQGEYPRSCWGVQVRRHGPTSPETIELVASHLVGEANGRGDIVVQVTASSVNPVDWKIGHGYFELIAPPLPYGLGFDYCGTVVYANRTKRLKVGDRVFGMCEFGALTKDLGAFAEYVKTNEANAAPAPDNLSDIEAASLPLVCLTSYQALREGGLAAGHKLLILGGASGTGAAGIQLAKAMGAATVVVTCSGGKTAFCQGLGADRCVDYRTDDWRQTLHGEEFDVIYDCVGGVDSWDAASDSSRRLLKSSGRFVTIAGDKQSKFNLGKALSTGLSVIGRKLLSLWPTIPNYSFVTCQASASHLAVIRRMAEEGRVRPTIDTVYPLGRIWDALAYSESQRVTGKICLDCRPPIVPQPPAQQPVQSQEQVHHEQVHHEQEQVHHEQEQVHHEQEQHEQDSPVHDIQPAQEE